MCERVCVSLTEIEIARVWTDGEGFFVEAEKLSVHPDDLAPTLLRDSTYLYCNGLGQDWWLMRNVQVIAEQELQTVSAG